MAQPYRYRVGIICMVCLWSLVPGTPAAWAGVVTQVRGIGYAAVHAGDLATAYEQAKRAALREAVEEASGTLVSSRSLVQNFSLVEDRILTHSRGYVRSYEVLAHGPDSTMGYRVALEAIVDLGNLHKQLDALAVLTAEMDHPRLACLATVQTATGQPAYLTEDLIVDRLNLVLTGANEQLQIIRYPARSAQSQAQLAQTADMAIAAYVQVQPEEPVLIPFGAGQTLDDIGIQHTSIVTRIEAWWLDSGEPVTQLAQRQTAIALNSKEAVVQAFNNSMAALAGPLVAGIAANWRKKVYGHRILRLEIHAAPELIQRFERDVTSQLGGVHGVQARRYESRLAVYDVQATCAAFYLARQLSAHDTDLLEIEIQQVTANTLTLALRAPQAIE